MSAKNTDISWVSRMQKEKCEKNHYYESFVTYRFFDSFRQMLNDHEQEYGLWDLYREDLRNKLP